jgi:phosphatidyl-myo-inositol dimannoside synthase
MKILLLIPDAFGGRGGIAKFNRDLVTSLCKYTSLKEVIAIPRNIVDPIDFDSLPSKLTYISNSTKGKIDFITSTIKSAVTQPRINLVICGHINLLPLAHIAKFLTRAPLFLVMHGYEVWQPSPYAILHSAKESTWQLFLNWFNNGLLHKVDGVISVSEFTLEKFLGWSHISSNIPTFVLPNTVNLEGFKPGSKSPTLLDRYQLQDRVVLMTLGRLSAAERYKGFDEVLDILPALIQDIPNLKYMIVGEGNDRSRLESKAKDLGLEDYVIFTGFIAEVEKADHYRVADVYVMPGKGEGFGIVYLEAMACGIPVVASKIDGSREAVRNGMLGTLVDPDDPEDIKAGIINALKQPTGTVPDGLDYFSDQSFEQRVHLICDEITKLVEKLE